MPALRPTGWLETMSASARQLGWHSYPAPAAINSVPYGGRPGCTYCGFCKGNGCHVGAKGSTDVSVITDAEASGRLRIETGARVTRIEVDATGRVDGVAYVKNGTMHRQHARMVVLGCFVYENARLLLTSTSSTFPTGLSNNHGQVGRHFTMHVMPYRFGLFPGLRLRRLNGSSGGQAVCVDDWNADDFDHQGLGFLGGSLLMALQQVKPIECVAECTPPGQRRWGSRWKRWVTDNAHSVGSAYAQIDTPTYEDCFLDLDPVRRDPFGIPVVRVTFRVHDSERRASTFMGDRLEQWLRRAGASEVWGNVDYPLDGRHACGGTRMGDDAETSVVDRWGFSHEVPNLCVVGASTFPTAGGYNPTLTVQALAWRTAQAIVEQWTIRTEGRS